MFLYVGIGIGLFISELNNAKENQFKSFKDAASTLTAGLVITLVWPACLLLPRIMKK